MSDSNSGLDIQRLSALSDGIFAVAMTLPAFSIHLPESSAAGRLANELTRMCHEGIGLVVSFWIAAMLAVAFAPFSIAPTSGLRLGPANLVIGLFDSFGR
jgi:hypothetical protein